MSPIFIAKGRARQAEGRFHHYYRQRFAYPLSCTIGIDIIIPSAGTLRADGATYTNMAASFPAFYAWVKASGLAVPMASYALVEGSCGRYELDESTGSVRMPTLAAGVFGASAASQYGQAVEAGLPNITGTASARDSSMGEVTSGAFYQGPEQTGFWFYQDGSSSSECFDASRSSAVYGKSDTVTPSHVKYPWVIVVYNAATPASVAEAGEFVGMLDGKADKAQVEAKAGVDLENVTAEGRARVVGWGMPDHSAAISISSFPFTVPTNGYIKSIVPGANFGGISINKNTEGINQYYYQQDAYGFCRYGYYTRRKR